MHQIDPHQIGTAAIMQAAREAAGLTLPELAARLGVSRWTVQRWERGEVQISRPCVIALACVLACPRRNPDSGPAPQSRKSGIAIGQG